MNKSRQITLLFLILFSVELLITKTLNHPLFPYSLILFTALLIVIQVNHFKVHRRKKLLIQPFAYLLALTADVFLNFTPYALLHILFFAFTHIVLIGAFYAEVPIKGNYRSLLVTGVISALLYGGIVVPALPHPLAIPFLVYITLLTFMLWRAYLYTQNRSISKQYALFLFTGAVLFYVTDVLVGIRILYKPALINIPIYIVYPPALFLIAIAPWYREAAKTEITVNTAPE